MSNVLDMTLSDEARSTLETAAERVREAKGLYDHTRQLREHDIRDAAAAGATYREIAEASGVAFQRVGQIITGDAPPTPHYTENRAYVCPECGVGVGEVCKGTVIGHRARTDLLMADFAKAHPEVG